MAYLSDLIYIFYAIAAYLVSIFVKYILDKKWSKFRFDNWLLFMFLAKAPLADSKAVLTSKTRPDILKIKENISKEFSLSKNEKPSNNSYIFLIKDHPTPFKIQIIEPEGQKSGFTITLQTEGKDKIPKIMRSSFKKTIEYFDQIVRKLDYLGFKHITVIITMEELISDNDNLNYNYKGNAITSKTIDISSNRFTSISPLVKECIGSWRNKFL
jgi:hypothetical protein